MKTWTNLLVFLRWARSRMPCGSRRSQQNSLTGGVRSSYRWRQDRLATCCVICRSSHPSSHLLTLSLSKCEGQFAHKLSYCLAYTTCICALVSVLVEINWLFLTHNWQPCQAEPRSLTFIYTTKRNKTIQGVKWLHALQAKTSKKSNNMTPQGTYNKETKDSCKLRVDAGGED